MRVSLTQTLRVLGLLMSLFLSVQYVYVCVAPKLRNWRRSFRPGACLDMLGCHESLSIAPTAFWINGLSRQKSPWSVGHVRMEGYHGCRTPPGLAGFTYPWLDLSSLGILCPDLTVYFWWTFVFLGRALSRFSMQVCGSLLSGTMIMTTWHLPLAASLFLAYPTSF